ncbi:MAG: hypothetical protein AAGF53_01055 [Pseudomonadota bacterium]
MTRKLLVSATALAVATGSAFAEDGDSPFFEIEGVIELQTDFNFDSDDPDAELNDIFFTIEPAITLNLGRGATINASLVFEPIIDATDDRFIEDHGLFAEELFYAQEFGNIELVLGKFNPAFGVAWDATPGIFGVDFAEDYEITERIGAGVNIGFDAGEGINAAFGDIGVSFAVFQADRTVFSEAIGEDRPRLTIEDGGVSNTSGLQSFSLALTGDTENTSWNIGYQYQEGGEGDPNDQQGFVAGIIHAFGEVEVIGEIAYFDDFEGSDSDAVYYTGGISVPVGPVSLSGAFTVRDIDDASTDTLITTTAEYEIFENFTAAIGYKYAEEDSVDTHTIGTLWAYEF